MQEFFKYSDVKPPKSDYYLHISSNNWVGSGKPSIYFYNKEKDEWESEEMYARHFNPMYWAYVKYPELPIEEKKRSTGKKKPCENCIGDYRNGNINEPDSNCEYCEGDGLTKYEYERVPRTVFDLVKKSN